MFTGIIKALGRVERLEREGTNVHFTIASPLSRELSIDQSVAHDGVCLTVVEQAGATHRVTAVQETLRRTTLGDWAVGTEVNLELAMQLGARLDGHLVQGHVDATATVTEVRDEDGSWTFRFAYGAGPERVLVDKGSICVSGVSLTVVDPTADTFGVAVIPYTFAHTGFKNLRVGSRVNLEFDIIGKYVVRYAALYGSSAADVQRGVPRG